MIALYVILGLASLKNQIPLPDDMDDAYPHAAEELDQLTEFEEQARQRAKFLDATGTA